MSGVISVGAPPHVAEESSQEQGHVMTPPQNIMASHATILDQPLKQSLATWNLALVSSNPWGEGVRRVGGGS